MQCEIIFKKTWLLPETNKVSPFVKFKIIPPLLWYLPDLLQICKTGYEKKQSSTKNYVNQEVSKESSCHQEEGLITIYRFQEEMFR